VRHFAEHSATDIILAMQRWLTSIAVARSAVWQTHLGIHGKSASLRSVPGIGKVLALTILYEIHDISRFDRVQEFASYARLVKCTHQSAGKTLGTGGAKMGNVHLKWAFSEAAVLFVRHAPGGKKLVAAIAKKHDKGKALSILADKIGRAVFYMLSRRTVFCMEKFRAA
jgi:transposase